MKSVRSMIIAGVFGLLPACQVGLSASDVPVPSPAETPVASQPPSPGPGPDQSPSASPMPSLSPTPSVSPTPSISPTPNTENLERYVNNAYCEPVANALATRTLDYLHDVVVSPDGETVYVTFSRNLSLSHPEQNFSLPISPFYPVSIIPRQLIYRLDSTGQLVPVQVDGTPPHSCHLTPEIEKDAEGRLVLVQRVFDAAASTAIDPTREYAFYHLTPAQNTLRPVSYYLNLGPPDPSPSSRPPAQNIVQLHIPTSPDTQNAIYYGLATNYLVYRNSFIQKLTPGKLPENLLIINRGGPGQGEPFQPFSILPDGDLTYGGMRASPPYPAETTQHFTNDGRPQAHPQWQALIPADEERFKISAVRPAPTAPLLYISDNTSSHSLWRLDLITGQASRLAGSGQAGYQDGTGEQAQFNQPGALDIDQAGNIYVADVGNQAIRKITPEGVVSTLFKGDEVPPRRQQF